MNSLEHILIIPGIVGIKNSDSTYKGINQLTANLLGFKNPSDIVGKTDYELPCAASQFASHYIAQDKKVFLTKKSLTTFDIQNYATGWKIFISTKNLLQNASETDLSLIINCTDVSNTIFSRYYYNLFQIDAKKFGTKFYKSATYILNSDHCPLLLTKKQEQCLFFLIRGKSLKEIATILGISHRTVEDHIDSIKNKLQCQTKRELIEKAIDCGFLYYLPKILQQN